MPDEEIKHALIVKYDWGYRRMRPIYGRVTRDRPKTLFTGGEHTRFESRYQKSLISYKFYATEDDAKEALKEMGETCGVDIEDDLSAKLKAASKTTDTLIKAHMQREKWEGSKL